MNSSLKNDPRENVRNKVKKSSKTGQDQKTLISAFCIISDNYYWTFISVRETRHWTVSLFAKILSFKLFGNSSSNSYTMFFILDIKFPFTFGKIQPTLTCCKVPKYYVQECSFNIIYRELQWPPNISN